MKTAKSKSKPGRKPKAKITKTFKRRGAAVARRKAA